MFTIVLPLPEQLNADGLLGLDFLEALDASMVTIDFREPRLLIDLPD